MSNNKLTDRKIAEILARAEICDDSVLTDYTDIAAAMRELQERRRLDGIQHAVCEVCGVPCNNPNHPQMAVAHEYSAQPVPVVPEECPAELPYAQVKAAADLYALCWQSGEVVTYTPAPEKATIWLNNYSGTCVQEYVKLERLQEALAGNSPVIPEDLRRAFEAVARLNNEMYRWTSRMFYNGSYVGEPEGLLKRNIREIEHIMDSCRAAMLQDNQRDLSQPVDPQVAEYEQIMLQAGNSPVSPDGWISRSERMPDNDESKPIAIFTGKCLGQGMFVATYDDDGFFDYWEGMEIIGVSHWMPLPEPPQQ